jgi:FixJ family two-component response regulator
MANQKLVFVIDDDPSMRQSIARLLQRMGYDSLAFSSCEEVEGRTDFARVLCVLLDINVGEVSGIELKRRLNEAGITIPVIYMTGSDRPAVREAALQSGCVAYLTKPFSVDSLMEALQRAAVRDHAH